MPDPTKLKIAVDLLPRQHFRNYYVLLQSLLSLSVIPTRSPEMFMRVSFARSSAFEVSHVRKHGGRSTHQEEYRNNFIQKCQPLMPFGPHISFSHLPQSFAHVQHRFMYWRWGRAPRTSSSTLSRTTSKRLYHSYTWNYYTLAATCLISQLVLSPSKTKLYIRTFFN